MALVPVTPRPLSNREISVLSSLLSVSFDGVEQLRAQLSDLRVVATWGEGSPSVDLEPSPGCPRSEVEDGELPVVGEVRDAAGDYVGELTLMASNGFLSAIEYAWVTDIPPASLPDPESITVIRC